MLNQPRIRIAVVVLIAALLGGSVMIAIRNHAPSAGTPITITTPASADSSGAADSNGTGQAVVPTAPDVTPASSAVVSPAANLYVHITGAVKSPNLYQLPQGSRVNDAIKAAGGAKDSADLNAINLAEKLQDGEKVYVPTRAETKSIPPMIDAAPQNSIAGVPAAVAAQPAVGSAAKSPGKSSAAKTSSGAKGGAAAADTSKPDKLTSPAQGTIDINTATAEALMRLPGVGKATAARIVAYRASAGAFKKPEDLMNVSGIGDKKFAKLSPFIRVN
jgi:competence protein ComEA